MKAKLPVGTVPCPIKGCDEIAAVFKYEGGPDESRRRFAGRLYCVCPTHRRIENQEYLLEHIQWSKPEEKPEARAIVDKAAVRPMPAKSTPAPMQEPQPQKKKPSGWLPDYFK